MRRYLILFACILCISFGYAQSSYPTPHIKPLLFYIQHNRGTNTYIYQPNFLPNGKLNPKNPILVKRQLFDEDGAVKPLTAVQRKLAYGVQTKQINSDLFEFSIVSYPSQKLFLKQTTERQTYVETDVNGHRLILDRIFIIQREGTSGLGTKVDKMIFYGKDMRGRSTEQHVDIR